MLTERPEWLIGEPLRPNLPRGKDARPVERWMNELQMLLFTHPVNIAREDHGLPPINVVWLWGFGDARKSLPVRADEEATSKAAPTHLSALRNGDIAGWQRAWADISSDIQAADSILLGDARPALRLTPRAPSVGSRFRALFKRKATFDEVLAALQGQL